MTGRRITRRPSLLSAEDVNKLYKHFIKLDSDGNGVVSKEEFLSSDSVAGNPLAMRLVEMIDADESGDINFSEFVAGLSVFSSKTSALNKLKFAFDVYDLDRDGYISNGELFVMLRLMTGQTLKSQQLQQIVDKTIRDADKDMDGRLSFDEFMAASVKRNADLLQRWSIANL